MKPEKSRVEVFDDSLLSFTLFFLFIGALTYGVWYCVDKYNQATNEPQTREIKLSDGTPCVINKNGGIACNWRNNK